MSWRIHYGEIPAGLCVLHRCDVRHCVRPDHLFLGTRTDNMRDKVEKGRQTGPARRTHCPKGHEYDEQNTRVRRRANGTWYKQCRICDRESKRNRQREYMREYRAKKRAA
ncbi:MAG: HNH endonuclease [Candidatus Krumholzibacteria bacterium]|nr:HNH endonuclease [Candidatus Krumholzibacteria bacterium]